MTDISMHADNVDNAIALVIFAHGAGADKDADFMVEVSAKLNQQKINVLRFNFPYMDRRLIDGKRYPPNRMPILVECFTEILASVDSSLPIFLMGKSMGGRVAATLACEELTNVLGIICLGYPFHPQKQPEKLRLAPLQETKLPVLIIQGDRDALGNKDEISQYQISPQCQLVFLDDGDHNLKPRMKSGFTHQQHINSAINEITRFIDEIN